jgi:hypothetical protein
MGRLLVTVKWAHVYETELAYVLGVLTKEDSGDDARDTSTGAN